MSLGPHNLAEITAALICTICLLYKPSVINRWFVWFLWLTVCVELTGKLTVNFPYVKLPMYNVLTAIEFIVYAVFIIEIIINELAIKITQVSIRIFMLFWAVNLVFFQQPLIYNTYTATASALLLCFFCLLYFYESIVSDNETANKWSELLIVSGIFLFYAGSFKIYSSFNLLAKKLPKDLSALYNLIANNLNVILYSFFAIAFILEVIIIRSKENNIPISN